MKRDLMLVLISVVLALVAFLMIQQGSGGDKEEMEKMEVLVATEDLAPNDTIDLKDNVEIRPIELVASRGTEYYERVKKLAIASYEVHLYDGAQVLHGGIRRDMVVLKSDLYHPSLVKVELKPGERLISLPLTPAAAPIPFLGPGSRVDIYCFLQPDQPSKTLPMVPFPILQNVYVQAIGNRRLDRFFLPSAAEAKERSEVSRTVTVAVTPREGELLMMAQMMANQTGQPLRFLVRDPNEAGIDDTHAYPSETDLVEFLQKRIQESQRRHKQADFE